MLKIGKNSQFDKLSWQRQTAVIQLFEKTPLKKISQKAKVHINTIEYWKSLPEFQEAQIEYSRYAFSHLLPDVVSNLKHILEKGNDRDKLQAIRIILDNGHLLDSEDAKKLVKIQIEKARADTDKSRAEARLAEARTNESQDKSGKLQAFMDKQDDKSIKKMIRKLEGDTDG